LLSSRARFCSLGWVQYVKDPGLLPRSWHNGDKVIDTAGSLIEGDFVAVRSSKINKETFLKAQSSRIDISRSGFTLKSINNRLPQRFEKQLV
jgi:hypothetical protein